MSTLPADRDATENAISGLYCLLDRPPPTFVWVESPAAAVGVLGPPRSWRWDTDLPLEGRLATLVSGLRHRIGVGYTGWRSAPPEDPVAAMRSGMSSRSLVDSAVHGVLSRVVRESVAGVVRAALGERTGLLWFGQHDVDWIAQFDVIRQVLGARIPADDVAHAELWSTLARSCGWWVPRESTCVVVERPCVVRTEPVPGSLHGELRLHTENGPAMSYSDGWAVHSWHGMRVPSWVVEGPTVDLIAAEPNIEVRRCAIEHLGWPAFIAQAGLALVGQAADPGNPGSELRLYDLPYQRWGTSTRLLLAVNGSVERDGTRRQYGLRVPPWFNDPIDAAGWSYGLTGAQYAQLQRRT
ncbi:DUF6745 domain-containing protein [Actinocrispum wychmicini]|uniref:DUF6745 domain-containing protein n=1 Tax=Actinocrispum wychmicini TaxID=1213861 RepID=UPI001FB61A0A|nr:hypothetical protein [Actinocrispum wychmicini]